MPHDLGLISGPGNSSSKPANIHNTRQISGQRTFSVLLLSSMLIGMSCMMAALIAPIGTDTLVHKFIGSLEGKKGSDTDTRAGPFYIRGYIFNETGGNGSVGGAVIYIKNMRTGDVVMTNGSAEGYFQEDVGTIFGGMSGLENGDQFRVNTTYGIFCAENYTTYNDSIEGQLCNLSLGLICLPEFSDFALPLVSIPILIAVYRLNKRK